jgi:hypothetical protein
MLKFVATQNVARYRAQLNDEIDPAKRIVLQRLLVEEEDRLGATFELLAEVRQAIADCKCRIAELRSLTENTEIDGGAAAVASAARSAEGCADTARNILPKAANETLLAVLSLDDLVLLRQ